MPNVDAPRGARPAFHKMGGVIRNAAYPIASAFASSIFSGDFVKAVAAGGIEDADAGDRLLGAFAGVRYVDPQGNQQFGRYWPAGQVATEIEALVFDDPNIVFECQADGVVTADDVFQLADHVATHAGNTATGQSGHEISSTTGTGTAGFRILGKVESPINNWGEANVDLLVQIYEHELTAADQATPGV